MTNVTLLLLLLKGAREFHDDMEKQKICLFFIFRYHFLADYSYSMISTNHSHKVYNYIANQLLGWCNICHIHNRNE